MHLQVQRVSTGKSHTKNAMGKGDRKNDSSAQEILLVIRGKGVVEKKRNKL